VIGYCGFGVCAARVLARRADREDRGVAASCSACAAALAEDDARTLRAADLVIVGRPW
jgi:hypothetical protein